MTEPFIGVVFEYPILSQKVVGVPTFGHYSCLILRGSLPPAVLAFIFYRRQEKEPKNIRYLRNAGKCGGNLWGRLANVCCRFALAKKPNRQKTTETSRINFVTVAYHSLVSGSCRPLIYCAFTRHLAQHRHGVSSVAS